MLKRFDGPRGRIVSQAFASELLVDNPWGDPSARPISVYLPPGYDADEDRRYPVLFDLVGYTGSGASHLNWKPFEDNVPERADRLIAAGMPPVIIVFIDGFTALGGNQYVDSSAVGLYARYLIEECVPFVDGRFRTLAGRDHRGVFGKSSGGYGAIIHAMKHADTWGAAACHSGDMYFDFVYRCDFPKCLNVLAKHERSVKVFLDHVHATQKLSSEEVHALMLIAMAATYDPDPAAALGFHMPVDLETGELDEERWARWLAHDPILLVDESAAALKSMRGLWIDCGAQDQYHLHYGARILHRRLEAAGVDHVYEEFDDDHSGIDYRMDRSLPFLARVLSGS